MLDLDTTVAEYIAFIKARHPCLEGIDKLEAFADKVTYIKDITTYINEGKSTWNPSWTYWTLMDHGDQMSAAMRSSFLKRITSPSSACSIYLDCDWLTDDDDIYLFNMFKDKMPNVIKNLTNGTTQRVKDSG